jgi:hypothetical protein
LQQLRKEAVELLAQMVDGAALLLADLLLQAG